MNIWEIIFILLFILFTIATLGWLVSFIKWLKRLAEVTEKAYSRSVNLFITLNILYVVVILLFALDMNIGLFLVTVSDLFNIICLVVTGRVFYMKRDAIPKRYVKDKLAVGLLDSNMLHTGVLLFKLSINISLPFTTNQVLEALNLVVSVVSLILMGTILKRATNLPLRKTRLKKA